MDFLLTLLFTNPYVPYLLGAVVVLLLYQQIASRLTFRAPALGGSGQEWLTKLLGERYAESQLQKTIARYKKEGHFLAAGKLLEDKGRVAQAIEAYVEGHEYWAAAANLEKAGKVDRAAELYLQAGDHKKAAQILEGAGKPARAATLFLEKGNSLDAARLFGVAGEWARAGELYARGGYPLRAAEAWEKAGDLIKAAESYEKHFMENVSYSTTYSSTAVSPDQKSALSAGRLYQLAGDLARALQAFQRGGYFKEAGDVSMRLNQFPRAAELYMRAGDMGRAAEAYEKAGDPVQAANLRGEVALKEERVAEAAAFFQKGRDYLRSAELYESAGLLAEAAAAYEAGDSPAAAGAVYIRAGLTARAAAAYERARDFETAAGLYEQAGHRAKAVELYEKAGFTFKSGEAAARAGERDKAIALLQRVSPSDESYAAATELLARLFLEGGLPGLAVERIQKALGGQAVSGASLDLFYWLAVALDTAGRTREALELFRKIQAEDLLYRDVEKRAARLEKGGTAPPLPIPPVADPAVARQSDRRPAAEPAPAGPVNAAPPPAPAATTAPPRAAAPGAAHAARAPRFAFKEEKGRGPLGVVYRAEDADGRSVALRVLPPDLLRQEGVLHALAADLKAAAQVSHPNLVKVLGLVDVDGRRCVVTEFVAGRNFADAVSGGHRLSVQQAHSLGRMLAQVLATLHGRGLAHGSIQPSNIMVSSGVVKVADLGLGRFAHRLGGGRSYHAPEDGFDSSGDLYAMAAVLYHLLTGVHPKSQPQGVALPLPSSLAAGVPEALDRLLLRCLHPRPDLRLRSAEQVLGELKDMVRIV